MQRGLRFCIAAMRFSDSMFCGSSTITIGLTDWIKRMGSCPFNRSLGLLMIFSSLAKASILITSISMLSPVANPLSFDIWLLS